MGEKHSWRGLQQGCQHTADRSARARRRPQTRQTTRSTEANEACRLTEQWGLFAEEERTVSQSVAAPVRVIRPTWQWAPSRYSGPDCKRRSDGGFSGTVYETLPRCYDASDVMRYRLPRGSFDATHINHKEPGGRISTSKLSHPPEISGFTQTGGSCIFLTLLIGTALGGLPPWQPSQILRLSRIGGGSRKFICAGQCPTLLQYAGRAIPEKVGWPLLAEFIHGDRADIVSRSRSLAITLVISCQRRVNISDAVSVRPEASPMTPLYDHDASAPEVAQLSSPRTATTSIVSEYRGRYQQRRAFEHLNDLGADTGKETFIDNTAGKIVVPAEIQKDSHPQAVLETHEAAPCREQSLHGAGQQSFGVEVSPRPSSNLAWKDFSINAKTLLTLFLFVIIIAAGVGGGVGGGLASKSSSDTTSADSTTASMSRTPSTPSPTSARTAPPRPSTTPAFLNETDVDTGIAFQGFSRIQYKGMYTEVVRDDDGPGLDFAFDIHSYMLAYALDWLQRDTSRCGVVASWVSTCGRVIRRVGEPGVGVSSFDKEQILLQKFSNHKMKKMGDLGASWSGRTRAVAAACEILEPHWCLTILHEGGGPCHDIL
ncbi:hypothetical protein Purlil1_12184 [Purpureocillium lilacinum]|uniref:Uncharacterized protein n=1 Tax=Purpureocillium lilacinum TaxID=33203 RepID=A0ABR0BHK4_PURLI|nr:hypothetical protein Purlil1_12184 [Purpureocillium lilacinum]